MRRNVFFFLAVVTMILLSCSSNKGQRDIIVRIEKSNVVELFSYAYEYRKDSEISERIYNVLMDSLYKISKDRLYGLRTFIVVDDEKGLIDYKFMDAGDMLPHFKKGFTCSIDISDSGIFMLDNYFTKPDEMKDNVLKFMSRSDEECNCYYEKEIKHFGIVSIPKGGFLLSVKLDDRDFISYKQWHLLLECIEELYFVNGERLDQISNTKWGINFSTLSIDKKESVMDFQNFLMFILFE